LTDVTGSAGRHATGSAAEARDGAIDSTEHEVIMISDMSLLAGLVIGFSIAVPVGPMSLLCIQRSLSSGMRVSFCTGLGAATVNVAQGAAVISGLNKMMPLLAGREESLHILTGVFLLWSAARILMRRGGAAAPAREVAPPPFAAYLSAIVFNATNPMSAILVVALLSPVARDTSVPLGDAAALLCGMFVAAAIWWSCLSGGVSLLRARLQPDWILRVNQAAGMLLTAYGTLALCKALG
jgi:threonine/homoserine/homoserine lactone efflux protein